LAVQEAVSQGTQPSAKEKPLRRNHRLRRTWYLLGEKR
jgi:hypothetical protein